MDKEQDQIALLTEAVIHLEAEVGALRLLVGIAVAESPTVIDALERLAPHLEGLALSFQTSDQTNARAQEVLAQVLEVARSYRSRVYPEDR